ncbi:MAG: hypothetical protein MRECE_24c007 [Mycoplasmataceae bacterium CE_OT135]|nr:MAG: hypothetical protein MRECE_24c007 [Mycoplasmataceae bacterium CE_OT135]
MGGGNLSELSCQQFSRLVKLFNQNQNIKQICLFF